MSATKPSWWGRAWHTPIRDIVRFRMTGRLDWRNVIYKAGLPDAAAQLIVRVVRKTRLWRIEKADVAGELVAHFADGLEAGTPIDELIETFGDARQAARLIRRGKRRQRSLMWKASCWMRRAVVALILLYIGLGVYFLVGSPSVNTNYLAQLNEPVQVVPEAERAWPEYRAVLLELGFSPERNYAPQLHVVHEPDEDGNTTSWRSDILGVTYPGDEHWPIVAGFLDEHAGSIDRLRRATDLPAMGYVYSYQITPADAQLLGDVGTPDATWENGSMLVVLLPHTSRLHKVAYLIEADAHRAMEEGDVDRAIRDIVALDNLSRQLADGPTLVEKLMALAIHNRSYHALASMLERDAEVFSTAQLMYLAHALGPLDPAVYGDMSGERIFFQDTLQRIYTDDGNGDGRMTYKGWKLLVSGFDYAVIGESGDGYSPTENLKELAVLPGVGVVMASRKQMSDEYDRLMNMTHASMHVPLHEMPHSGAEQIIIDRMESFSVDRFRYGMASILMPAMNVVRHLIERAQAAREGVLFGIALELYRREHSRYPETLDALTPKYLPELPIDRMTGEPLKYRLIDGRPVIYSVGTDTDDDGGRTRYRYLDDPVYHARPYVRAMSNWTHLGDTDEQHNGDWVIWPMKNPPRLNVEAGGEDGSVEVSAEP